MYHLVCVQYYFNWEERKQFITITCFVYIMLDSIANSINFWNK